MNKLISFWKKPTETFELIFSKDINWFKTILFFSCNGIIVMYYIMRSQEMINIESFKMTILTIFFLLLTGMIYGLFTNFIVGFLIKLTGKLFNGTNDLKKIYKALSWSYYPLIISVYLIIVNILISRIILMTEIDTSVLLILSFVVIIFSIFQGILAIWQLMLLIRGLKIAQGLSTSNTILNYLSGALIFGLSYFLLTYDFL